jgi:hypothetical protein
MHGMVQTSSRVARGYQGAGRMSDRKGVPLQPVRDRHLGPRLPHRQALTVSYKQTAVSKERASAMSGTLVARFQ